MVVCRPVADGTTVLAHTVFRIAQESDEATAEVRIHIGQYDIRLARFI